MNHDANSFGKQTLVHDRPPGTPFLGHFLEMRKDPLEFFSRVSQTYGDVVPLKFGVQTVYMINHPEHVQRIFQGNRDNYVRSKYYGEFSPIIGDGLFTLEGKAWRHQRKAAQPSVSGPNLAKMTDVMVSATGELIKTLGDYAKKGEHFDFGPEAFKLKLKIVMRALFSADLDKNDFETVLDSLTYVLREIEHRVWQPVPVPYWVPSQRNRGIREAMDNINSIIERVVETRLSQDHKPGDLLDMLIEAEAACGWDDNSARSIRDQVISIAIAGHETGAITLCWAAVTLSKDVASLRYIRDEANEAFGNAQPTFETFRKLEFTQKVFKEILRLYPPLWTVSRQAIEDDYLGTCKIPKGGVVMISPYVIQRNPRFWDNPLRFDPNRFTPEAENLRHKFSYFPFGGGPHLCLGNRFGTLEGVLSLAMIAQKFDFELVGGHSIMPYPATTLRPDRPVFVKVHNAHGKRTALAA